MANFFGNLAILFIGLQLTHVIDWSWWWLVFPLLGLVISQIFWLAVMSRSKKQP